MGCGVGTAKMAVPSQPTGIALNVFPLMKFGCNGHLTKMIYHANKTGSFYFGIWERHTSNSSVFRLLSKRRVTANALGIQVYTVVLKIIQSPCFSL